MVSGKRNDACQLLAEIYGWFTEGFDTADGQEAKTLLAELTEGIQIKNLNTWCIKKKGWMRPFA